MRHACLREFTTTLSCETKILAGSGDDVCARLRGRLPSLSLLGCELKSRLLIASTASQGQPSVRGKRSRAHCGTKVSSSVHGGALYMISASTLVPRQPETFMFDSVLVRQRGQLLMRSRCVDRSAEPKGELLAVMKGWFSRGASYSAAGGMKQSLRFLVSPSATTRRRAVSQVT